MTTQLILGSSSPRRRALLALLKLPFIIVLPNPEVDETPLPTESPTALVQRLSLIKAQAVATTIQRTPPQLPPDVTAVVTITADTTVSLAGQILNKPQDAAEATAMLTNLRERPHQVYTGVTVGRWPIEAGQLAKPDAPDVLTTLLHENQLLTRAYTDAEIAAYIATGDPFDKAGGYGIQHETFKPIARYEGCYAGVMGLPLAVLAASLTELGLAVPPVAPLCEAGLGQPCCQAG